MDLSRLFEWTIFLGIILFAIYTMIAIREEKEAYVENAVEFEMKNFIFFIPSWWTRTSADEDENYASFKRADTHYDWKAELQWFDEDSELEKLSIEEILINKLKDLKLMFDPEESHAGVPAVFEEFLPYKEGRIDIIHIEGTATEDMSERVYFDAYLIKDLINNSYLLAKSRSSILNGAVEGPYFEEVMRTFEFLHQ
ncbi:hypothetical protein [Halobacteriovorax sp. HLS]|uniref:hypothetical protein n=1 Tax=Halobacteriovorax sp. HLS TaxID=2234000 RepID=UPI000FD6C5EE|nr:hypothetical protein [Halobacteriovorax sp. HLS]